MYMYLVEGCWIPRSKYHRSLPVDGVHHNWPDGVHEEVVAMYPGRAAARHLKQEGAVTRDELEGVG